MNDLQKLQQIDLQTLKEFIKICDKNNLRYMALGGTMLGAVRHQGFIPWDDDIDIGMPREDYEKFINCCHKELPDNYQIRNFKNDEIYKYYITRILDMNYPIIEIRNKDVEKNTYISIDIFPLDGLPKNTLLKKIHEFKVMWHRAKMSIGYIDTIDKNRERPFFEKLIISIITRVPIDKLIDPNKEKYKIDSLLKKYDFNESYYFSNLMGAYRTKEVFPKNYIGNYSNYLFEDIEIKGVENYSGYLKDMYGDYMTIPSEENISRKTHFEFCENFVDASEHK